MTTDTPRTIAHAQWHRVCATVARSCINREHCLQCDALTEAIRAHGEECRRDIDAFLANNKDSAE